MSPRRFYGVPALAHILDVSASTVRRWLKDGTLPSHLVPGTRRRRVSDADLRAFAERSGIPIDLPSLPKGPQEIQSA
jgi:excisionase family DNA binding protein